MTKLCVPPPIIRPSIKPNDDSRARGEDDITLELQEIFKLNAKLAVAVKVSEQKLLLDELQAHISMYIHHDSKAGTTGGAVNFGRGPPHSNRERRFYHKRLKGKQGRIRRNLSGKRVNNCSRSVISPAPTYDIDEVGVPRTVAGRLTFTENVNQWNIAALQKRVRVGSGKLDGAVRVVYSDGSDVDLKLIKDPTAVRVEIGCKVERYMQQGDVVMFNRQPSLHKMSIMAHRVRLTDDLTFRLPVCNATPFNADFDGDEMNLFFTQNTEAHAEQQLIMSARHQIISPQNNKPIIGLIQDSLISAYILTSQDTMLKRHEVMQLMMEIRHPVNRSVSTTLPLPAVLKPQPLWTGKTSVQHALSFGIAHSPRCARRRSRWPYTQKTRIVSWISTNATLLLTTGSCWRARCAKKMLGTVAGGVVHVLVNDLGVDTAASFLGDSQRLLVSFMLLHGFSVGVRDCLSTPVIEQHVKQVLDACNRTVTQMSIIGKTSIGTAAALGCLDDDSITDRELEASARTAAQNVLSKASAAVQAHMSFDNNIKQMVDSGSKGTAINIAQIMGCVGQQSVEGKRIKVTSNGRDAAVLSLQARHKRRRTRSMVKWRVEGLFVKNYTTGLSAQGYFFHAMGGREGLVDTAVKTAQTGYIQRRLMKAQEGLQVRYDNTVRNQGNAIIQTLYGGDGLDPVKLERVSMWTVGSTDQHIASTITAALASASASVSASVLAVVTREVSVLCGDRDVFLHARKRSSALHSIVENTMYVPINIPRLLRGIVARAPRAKAPAPVYTCAQLDSFIADREHMLSKIKSICGEDAAMYSVLYFRSTLHVGVFASLCLTNEQWRENIWSFVFEKYQRSLVQPGEMVGAIGASAIGEPCTQMTLNTFHFSGVASKTSLSACPVLRN